MKKAKFFCENCNAEVDKNARFCTKCGKFFASVRCPKCGYTGSSHDFASGCPKCGYADSSVSCSSVGIDLGKNSNVNKNHFFFHKFHTKKVTQNKSKTNYPNSSLPLWVYLATLLALIVVIFLTVRCS